MKSSAEENALIYEALYKRKSKEDAKSTPWEKWKAGWRPNKNRAQLEGYRSPAVFKLYHGERGGGKGHCALDELVEHCFLESNAQGMIIMKETGMSRQGGIWDRLIQDILPRWKNGNLDRNGNKLDDGIGLEYSEPRLDPKTKMPIVTIENRFGFGCEIVFVSFNIDKAVEAKVKGREPSFIIVDEAQTLNSDSYFKYVIQQLGRRKRIEGKQKAIYCANPAGTKHWLYKIFFVDPYKKDADGNIVKDERFAAIHMPFSANEHNVPPNYYEDYVLPAIGGDRIERMRMVEGIWIDRPEGNALFAEEWSAQRAVKGSIKEGSGIQPLEDVPVIVSYDLGAPNSSIHMGQLVPTVDRVYKLIFDEFDYVGEKYKPYSVIVPAIIDRMILWEEIIGKPIEWVHISDQAAWHQYRAKDGSYDHRDVEELSKQYVEEKGLPSRFVIKMIPCPRGDGSIAARVRMLKESFKKDEIIVSASCIKTIEMFEMLEEHPEKALEPKRDKIQVHRFDSLSYGFFYYYAGRLRTFRKTHVPTKAYAMS